MPEITLRTDAETVQFVLGHGTHTVGRGPENDIILDHPSVSTRHCNLEVDGDAIVVADLGSANGTLVAGELVERAPWSAGRTLQIGPAYLNIVSERAVDPAGIGGHDSGATADPDALDPFLADDAASSPRAGVCQFHPDRPARFRCRQCGNQFCPACVKDLGRVGSQAVSLCIKCGTRCDPVDGPVASRSEASETHFFGGLGGAWAYPIRNDGWIMLTGASLLVALLDAIPLIGLIAGLIALFGMVLVAGYVCAFLQRIVTSSAQGEERMPAWPDISDFLGDILSPFLLFIGSVGLCLGPGWAMATFGDESMQAPGLVIFIIGLLYLPMGFLGVSMHDSLWALNPMLVLPSIFRVPVQYLVTCIVLAAAVALSAFSGTLIDLFRIPVLSTMLASFVSLYFLAVEMRLLGLLYWTNRDAFGWFRSG